MIARIYGSRLAVDPRIEDIRDIMQNLKIVIEKHSDCYIAYPLGLKGAVVGQGETYDDAVSDVKSAIAFHLETFGPEVCDDQDVVLEAFVAEARVAT